MRRTGLAATLLLVSSLLWASSADAAQGSYYCNSQSSSPNSCPLCATKPDGSPTACSSIQTVDNFWTNPNYCSLPATATPYIPSSNKATNNQICQNSEQGWSKGVQTIPIWTVPDASGSSIVQAGTAYVFVTYDLNLYVTMTFNCNYMLSTDPNSDIETVSVGLWSDSTTANAQAGGNSQ